MWDTKKRRTKMIRATAELIQVAAMFQKMIDSEVRYDE